MKRKLVIRLLSVAVMGAFLFGCAGNSGNDATVEENTESDETGKPEDGTATGDAAKEEQEVEAAAEQNPEDVTSEDAENDSSAAEKENPYVGTDADGKEFNLFGVEAFLQISEGEGCFGGKNNSFEKNVDYSEGLLEFGVLKNRSDGTYGFYPICAPVNSQADMEAYAKASFLISPANFIEENDDPNINALSYMPSSGDANIGVAKISGHRDFDDWGTAAPACHVGDILLSRTCTDLNEHVNSAGEVFYGYDDVIYQDWLCVAEFNDTDGVYMDSDANLIYGDSWLSDIAIEYAEKYGLTNRDVIVSSTSVDSSLYYGAEDKDYKHCRNCRIFICLPESTRDSVDSEYTRKTAAEIVN